MLSDIEIANSATLRPISAVAAETLGIAERYLVPYGHFKAKVDLGYLASLADRPLGRLCRTGLRLRAAGVIDAAAYSPQRRGQPP